MEKANINLERITLTAILTNKGRVLTGRSHPQIKSQVNYMEGERTQTEGFVTSNGKFVDRKEAASIFRKSGQRTHTGEELPENITELDSDHLFKF